MVHLQRHSIIKIESNDLSFFSLHDALPICLQAVFTEHFPIQDSRERYTLEFIHYALEAPKHSIEECIAQGLTYSIPLKAKLDRKSTRLNSSHVAISYAVFCSKNKRMSTSFL